MEVLIVILGILYERFLILTLFHNRFGVINQASSTREVVLKVWWSVALCYYPYSSVRFYTLDRWCKRVVCWCRRVGFDYIQTSFFILLILFPLPNIIFLFSSNHALSKKNHWMNGDIPWSWCCKVKFLLNERTGQVMGGMGEMGGKFEMGGKIGILTGNIWNGRNFRDLGFVCIHSMIFYWECGKHFTCSHTRWFLKISETHISNLIHTFTD